MVDGGSNDPLFVPLVPFSYFPFIISSFSQVATEDFNGSSRDPLFALSRVMTGQILRPWEIMPAKSHKKIIYGLRHG